MIRNANHLPRRTFLKGMGAALALPMLDAMVPTRLGRIASGAVTESVTRLGFIYAPNGMVMQNWTPAGDGEGFEFSRILKPIEKYRDKTLVISRLANNQANAFGDGGGGHARGGSAFLTAAHPKKTGGSDVFVGVSADQVVAQAIGNKTRLPSLEVGLDDSRTVGHCDSGYSCAYTNSISWKTPSAPLPPEASPRLLFEQLFGDIDTSIDAATRARRAVYRKSILDMTRDETSKLVGTLGANDKRKIDEYLTSIREIEKRIQHAEEDPASRIDPGIEKPAGIPTEFVAHAKLMYDLQVLAMQTDAARVFSFVIGREGSVRTYEDIGIPDPHHPLSHHRNAAEALEKLTRINTYHMELFSYFLDKLAATRDGDASLLDRTMLLYGSGISDSNQHLHENLPVMVVGGGGGIKGNRHLIAKQNTPIANLYLSLMDRMGVSPKSFGDSTGRLEI